MAFDSYGFFYYIFLCFFSLFYNNFLYKIKKLWAAFFYLFFLIFFFNKFHHHLPPHFPLIHLIPPLLIHRSPTVGRLPNQLKIGKKRWKRIKNWTILIGFLQCPLIGIRFCCWILNWTHFIFQSCWYPHLNCQWFDLEGRIA